VKTFIPGVCEKKPRRECAYAKYRKLFSGETLKTLFEHAKNNFSEVKHFSTKTLEQIGFPRGKKRKVLDNSKLCLLAT
jgi:hypothetical protein